jgi:broad specificity phosphatase PhoE
LLSYIYFIRHAQAGSRDNYDVLSDLGKQQAERLGEYLKAQGIQLTAAYSGTMRRQQHTAEIVCDKLTGRTKPVVTVDREWNEFSLAAVYRSLVPRLLDEAVGFKRDYEEMQEVLAREPHAVGGAIGRCDLAVIRAWMERRYPDFEGESWEAFKARIVSRIERLLTHNGEAVAVFTSATPIAILTGSAMGLTDDRIINVGGVLYNSGVTTMRLGTGGLRLFTLNATPHLPDSLRTFR